MLGIQYVIT